MPTIQRHSSQVGIPGPRQTSVAQAPQVAQEGVAEAQALGNIGRAASGVGQAIMGLEQAHIATLEKMEQARKDRNDRIIADSAIDDYNDRQRLEDIRIKTLKGKNAANVYADSKIWSNETREQVAIDNNLTPSQKENFDIGIRASREAFYDKNAMYQSKQMRDQELANLDKTTTNTDFTIREFGSEGNFDGAVSALALWAEKYNEAYPGTDNTKEIEKRTQGFLTSYFTELSISNPQAMNDQLKLVDGILPGEDVEAFRIGAEKIDKEANINRAFGLLSERYDDDYNAMSLAIRKPKVQKELNLDVKDVNTLGDMFNEYVVRDASRVETEADLAEKNLIESQSAMTEKAFLALSKGELTTGTANTLLKTRQISFENWQKLDAGLRSRASIGEKNITDNPLVLADINNDLLKGRDITDKLNDALIHGFVKGDTYTSQLSTMTKMSVKEGLTHILKNIVADPLTPSFISDSVRQQEGVEMYNNLLRMDDNTEPLEIARQVTTFIKMKEEAELPRTPPSFTGNNRNLTDINNAQQLIVKQVDEGDISEEEFQRSANTYEIWERFVLKYPEGSIQ